MRLSDLQDKDVVDIKTGVKIGNIVDIKIDNNGVISSLVIERKRFSKLFSTNDEIEVLYKNIVKIGEDVILIKDM